MSIMRRVQRLVVPRGTAEDDAPQGELVSEAWSPPPPTPDGWHTGPPDYIGIGVQKSGTTRWWKLIVAHPDVVGDALKETHHLSHLGWRPMTDADRHGYERYFPRPQGAIAGEWTPRYMNMPGIVDNMRALAPEARLLVMLRDPVERYRSGVGHWQKLKERRGKRLNLKAGRKDAFERSFYAFALRPYIEAFGRDRLEHLKTNSKLARTTWNPLFPINHTEAMARDLLGRLRRESWLVSKKRRYLDLGLQVLAAYLNYVRPRFNDEERSRAQWLGFARRRLRLGELVSWRQDWGRLSLHPMGGSSS